MKRTISVFLTLFVLCAVGLSAYLLFFEKAPAAEEAEPVTIPTENVSIAAPQDINQLHLRDVDALYKDDDPYDVVTMYLTVQYGNASDGTNHTWEEVNTHSAYYFDERGIDRYQVAALLQVGDETGPLPGQLGYGENIPNATVQIRGQTSSRNAQKNYKIELIDNTPGWNNQRTIALNKHQGEGMRFRNKLAYDLLSEIPQLMSLRTQFVHLYVRDLTGDDPDHFVDYGIYTQVEQLNKTAMKAHGMDKNGQLYKLDFFEFYEYEELKLVTDPDYDQKAFEKYLEIKGSSDHSKLLEMLAAVNDYTITSDELLDRYFDRENIAYWMAFMMLIGNSDTQSRNAYIYSPLNSSTWYFYPWDNDACLYMKELEIKNRFDFGDWERGVTNYWCNMMLRRALLSDSFRQELDDAVHDLYTNYLTTEHVREKVENYSATVLPYLYRMPDIHYEPLTMENYMIVKDSLTDEIVKNYNRYIESLDCPMPFYVDTPVYNGSQLQVNWENSFDFKNREIEYHVSLATDFLYENVLFEEDGLRLPYTTMNLKLEPGQYFLHVCATNSDGYTTNCFDIYNSPKLGHIYGTYSFFVREDGSIEVYEHVEGDR